MEPHFNGKKWHFTIPGTCPALSDTGCIIPYEERPFACKIAPFVLVPMYVGKERGVVIDLLLTPTCPHWREFGEHYAATLEEVKKEYAPEK
jgi:Fe-S-cluster containining protein